MKLCVLVIFYCLGSSAGQGDNSCTNRGGECGDVRCCPDNDYVSDHCSRGANRKCCFSGLDCSWRTMRFISVITALRDTLQDETKRSGDSRCTNRAGQCGDVSCCPDNNYVSNHCSGGANRKCCLSGLDCAWRNKDARCTTRGGECGDKNCCPSANYVSNHCAGNADRKCCLSGLDCTWRTKDARCTTRGGECGDKSCCPSANYVSNHCAGNADRKCCLTSLDCDWRNSGSSSGTYNCFGDFLALTPTGASAQTARQDRLSTTGVAASQSLVASDVPTLNAMKDCYYQAAAATCIHPAVIAAVASRESRGGRLLEARDGWGDCGRTGECEAYGILQCDIDHSGLGNRCTEHDWQSCAHLTMMVREVLVPKIRQVQRKHPSWASERQLQGGVAAYNFGVSNVQSWGGLDSGTWGDDYSNDVMARAQHLHNRYNWQ